MLATLGDLLEDVIVTVAGSGVTGEREGRELRLNLAADTASRVERRRGGSAANVAVAAARLGIPTRFVGCVGADHTGDHLVAALERAGVEVCGGRAGRTGTVVVIVHSDGERSMLTDRGAAVELQHPDRSWLDGVTHLHVPLYSMAASPLAATTTTLVDWAHGGGVEVSVDVSSTSLLDELGLATAADLLRQLTPAIVLANEAEAERLAAVTDLRDVATVAVVTKRGSRPAQLIGAGQRSPLEVPPVDLGPVPDTTGAGDAFAAGFIAGRMVGADLGSCAERAHQAAAAHLRALASAAG